VSEGSGPKAPALFVVVIALVALMPVFWLIGRRSLPPPDKVPILVHAGVVTVDLQQSRGGIAGMGISLPAPTDEQRAYHLRFLVDLPGNRARPPYRLSLDGPDGSMIWRETLDDPGLMREALDLFVPRDRLASGRHALRVEDAGGMVRSYPFIVP
jgi:hypothetical protein